MFILTSAQIAAMDEAIEAAYWQFDARQKGMGQWAGRPQSERDAFKMAVRALLAGEEDRYVIAAYHHGLSCHAYLQWWGPNHAGYVPDLAMAGIYSRAEAMSLDLGRDNAVAVPIEFLRSARLRLMLDVGDFANQDFRSHKHLRVALQGWHAQREVA